MHACVLSQGLHHCFCAALWKIRQIFFFLMWCKKLRKVFERSQVHVGYQLMMDQELQGFVAYMNFYLQLKASALRKAQKQNQ